MSGSRNSPVCGVCANKLVKNGTTSAGRTRWRCKHCGASST
ncbi:transposase-like zinc-binding domain-containing protein, partial [Gordonia sp. (in: high G+C Gram-positive bacteria)]